MKAPLATNKLGFKLALLIVSAGLVLGAGELALRLTSSSATLREPDPLEIDIADLPTLRWADLILPNSDGRYAGKRHRNNSAGFRGREVALQKPPGTYRTVIIGDSITMGQGVGDGETYAANVERYWNENSDRRHQALNLGLAGNNIRASVNRLEKLGLDYDPDLVIYGFTNNDLEQLPGYRMTRNKNRFRENNASPSYFVRFVRKHWYNLRNLFDPEAGSYIYELEENYYRNPKVWSAFEGELRRLDGLTRDRGSCLALFMHASISEANRFSPFAQFAEPVSTLAQGIGIPVFRSRAFYRGHSPEQLRVGFGDAHPNALGHELLAEALLDGLERLPDSCGIPKG